MSAAGPVRKAEGRTDWETPDEFFKFVQDILEKEFTLDGAASSDNTKTVRYYDEYLDAFKQEPKNEVIWLNPPYGKGLEDWIDLAIKWSSQNTVVMLLPASTDTQWFFSAAAYSDEIWFFTPRVQFVGTTSSNTTGSVVFVMGDFRPVIEPTPITRYYRWR